METLNNFSIDLTPEELITAIKLCGGGLIYALDDPFQSLEGEEAEKQELSDIEHLKSRAFISQDILGNYVMDLTLSEILDMMRYAETIVRVSQEGNPEQLSIYLISEDQVVWAPAGDNSKLVIFKDHESIWPKIEELFKDKPNASKTFGFQIQALELEIAQHFITENRIEDALRVFTENGIESNDATFFLDCVLSEKSRLRLDLTKVDRVKDTVTSSKVEVFSCPGGILWIESLPKIEDTNPRMVQISAGTIQDIRKKFLTLIA